MSGKLRMERCKLAGACATSIYMGYAIWLICSYAHAQGITPSSRSASVASVNYSDPVGKTICYLQDNIGQFWLQYGFNPQTKAPVGTIGQNGSAINLGSWTTDVGLVQTARHCYAFYNWAAAGYKPVKTSAAAEAACRFMITKMGRQQRKQSNMKEAPFVWSVVADGQTVTDQSSQLMGNWLAVLGLSQRALFLKSATAKAEALAAFTAVDAWAHDRTTGGYSEANSKPDTDSFPLPGTKAGFSRTVATHLSGIVALLPLFQATGNAVAKQRLLEMLNIICDRMHLTPSGLWSINYQPSGPSITNPKGRWVPVGSASLPTNMMRYGAHLQTSWIVADAVSFMSSRGHMTKAKAQACTATMMKVARKALEYGYDTQYGGVYELGYLPQSPQNSTDKSWFDQVEALQAMFWLNRTATSSVERKKYSSMLSKTLGFVLDKLVDHQYGEMFASVDRAGKPLPDKYGRGLFKGANWKATYHVGRFVVNFRRWFPAPCTPQQQQQQKPNNVIIRELATRLASA